MADEATGGVHVTSGPAMASANSPDMLEPPRDLERMRIRVHVREKVMTVQCGSGDQPVKWLGDVGVARYDANNGLALGPVAALKVERTNGTVLLDLTESINATLDDGENVYVELRGDVENALV